jgi:antitoxin (DNA-binding transcriptional repressor) of toxin-antitoxin stability system
MRSVQASEAKVHLPQLLDEVERGEIDAAIAAIKALRQRTVKIILEELLSARHAGHKY